MSAWLFASLDKSERRLTVGRHWLVKVTLVALALLVLTGGVSRFLQKFASDYWALDVLTAQVEHPFTPIDPRKFMGTDSDAEGWTSHLDKIAFRLTIPLIGHVLGLGAWSWPFLGSIAAITAVPLFSVLAQRSLCDRVQAAYLACAFASSGAMFLFVGDGTLGDVVAVAFLLGAMACRHELGILLCALAACFTDERGAIACLAIALYWLLPVGNGVLREAGQAHEKRSLGRVWAVALAIAIYIGLRILLGVHFGLHTGTSMMGTPDIMMFHLQSPLHFRVFDVLEFLWVCPLLALYSLGRSRRWGTALLCLAAAAPMLGVSLIIWDLERSLAYALVLLPLAWKIGLPFGAARATVLARCIFLGGLLHPLPWHIWHHPLRFIHFLLF